jgi:CheY-like chemotaxis protein
VARKVLIADDSPTVQKKAGGILTGEGYEVVTVSNGVAAVKKLPAVMPLVVLADVAMPGKDGYEVCEFVKSHGDLKAVPVLLVFSDSDPIEEERAARAHADGRICKPFKAEELVSLVGKYAAMAEAAAAGPVAPPPLPQAPPVYITEPMDAEPEQEAKQTLPDMSAFSGGLGIGDVTPEEPFVPPLPQADSAWEAAPAVEMARQEIAAPELPPPPPGAPPLSAEPVLVEDAALPPPPAEEESPPAERTMLFHAPAEIAEPVLSEESVAAPAPPSPVPVEPPVLEETPPEEPAAEPIEPAPEADTPAVAATTLESFSLHDAESGQVRFAAVEEAPPAPEAVAPPPAAAKTLDEAQIFSIVHQVVVKMSPPALSPQVVEDIARRFADEVIQELNSRP